ncbi:LysM domain-containing protein [Roseburia inulinivorans]|jgi:Fe-S cluster biosynthesis and repair protein YggX|uniref:LysM peptidoglycan-binding domain-containing protein n=1 Tax=Roseburia inulinivorans TaxID=360807 RepID=UPI000E5314E3|nr:LysM peptidoglycan-binding domain-containing protein [Roseburia sp.]RGS63916.1 LysM domain-containing protein [Roseburia inulinivorans]
MEENMYCQNRISYRVQEGDSLYKLAKQFHTTVTELILLNSGVNPYNLQTGMRLTICPGEGYVDENESKPSEGNTNKPTKTPVGGIVIIPGTTTQPGGTTRPGTTTQPGTATRPGTTTQPGNNMGVDLRQRMRMAWLNHITLVKFYLISFFENLSGQNAWKDAVYKNAEEILAIFAQYYPASAMQRFRKLFMEHLRLTDEVAAGLKADPAFSGAAMENWYINAEEIASFLSRQTPAYNETELRKMFYDHLDMERQQMEAYLDGDYETDIEIYLRSQQNMIELADFLTSGLLAR